MEKTQANATFWAAARAPDGTVSGRSYFLDSENPDDFRPSRGLGSRGARVECSPVQTSNEVRNRSARNGMHPAAGGNCAIEQKTSHGRVKIRTNTSDTSHFTRTARISENYATIRY